MRISLIIPTLNAGGALEGLLSRLWAQDLRPLEVIIIDSSSEDNTIRTAESFGAKTIVIPRRDFDHGRTRNVAAMEAQGDILVFMTQDAFPEDATLLRSLTAPLGLADTAAAYGRQIPRPEASPLEAFARTFNYPDTPSTRGIDDIGKYGLKTFFFSDVCSAVRKDAFIEIGTFPEGVRANEDMLIAAKLILRGYRVAYVPEATVIHSHSYSLFGVLRRYYNIGSSLRKNRWILNYRPAEREGARFMREQVKFVLRQRRYPWIPYIFLESAVKYAGFRIGLLSG